MTPWTVHVVTAPFRPERADHEDCPSCCGARHAVPDNQGGGNTGRLSCNPSDLAPRRLMLVVALDRWSQSARELAFHGTADTQGSDAIGLTPGAPDLYHVARTCPVHPACRVASHAHTALRSCAKIQMPRRGAVRGLRRGDERIRIRTQWALEPLRQNRRAREVQCARGGPQRCWNKEYMTVTVSHRSPPDPRMQLGGSRTNTSLDVESESRESLTNSYSASFLHTTNKFLSLQRELSTKAHIIGATCGISTTVIRRSDP